MFPIIIFFVQFFRTSLLITVAAGLINNNNNNNRLYSSQREIKAVVRSHNEEHISIILNRELHAQNQLAELSQHSATHHKHTRQVNIAQ